MITYNGAEELLDILIFLQGMALHCGNDWALLAPPRHSNNKNPTRARIEPSWLASAKAIMLQRTTLR
jgi:hypothetical protein